MAVDGCEGRRCETAGAAMVAYMLAYGRLCSDRSSIEKCKRRWSNALEWWFSGGGGSWIVALCYWGMAWLVSIVVRC